MRELNNNNNWVRVMAERIMEVSRGDIPLYPSMTFFMGQGGVLNKVALRTRRGKKVERKAVES